MSTSQLLVVLMNLTIVYSQVPTCVLRCKDEHMLKSANMHLESEWSQDFAFPLVSLLKSNGSVSAATQRLVDICSSNMQFSTCLSRCPESVERNIIATGLQPWIDLCQHLDTLQNELPCWKEHIRELANTCEFETFEVRKTMEVLSRNSSLAAVAQICRHMEKLSHCTVREYSGRCGENTHKIVVNLFSSARSTFTKMLNMKWKELPETCLKQSAPISPSTMERRPLSIRDNSLTTRSSPHCLAFVALAIVLR